MPNRNREIILYKNDDQRKLPNNCFKSYYKDGPIPEKAGRGGYKADY